MLDKKIITLTLQIETKSLGDSSIGKFFILYPGITFESYNMCTYYSF